MAADLRFSQPSSETGYCTLTWGDESYRAVSGPHKKGRLPAGIYRVKTRNAVDSGLSNSFTNPLTGRGWFVPIEPAFTTERGGFGIHPDGGTPGTLGCIGLTGVDTKKFWDRWLETPLADRPISLTVS